MFFIHIYKMFPFESILALVTIALFTIAVIFVLYLLCNKIFKRRSQETNSKLNIAKKTSPQKPLSKPSTISSSPVNKKNDKKNHKAQDKATPNGPVEKLPEVKKNVNSTKFPDATRRKEIQEQPSTSSKYLGVPEKTTQNGPVEKLPDVMQEVIATKSQDATWRNEIQGQPSTSLKYLRVPRKRHSSKTSSGGEFGDISSSAGEGNHVPVKEKIKQKRQSKTRINQQLCRIPQSPKLHKIDVEYLKPGHVFGTVLRRGGKINLPTCRINIPSSDSREEDMKLNIAICNRQKQRRGENELIFLTAALHIWSLGSPIHFDPPLHVKLDAKLINKDPHKIVDVTVQKTKSISVIQWEYYETVPFYPGKFIEFLCSEPGGYRVVSTLNYDSLLIPLNYALFVKRPTDIEDPNQQNFELWVYSDNLETSRQIQEEIKSLVDTFEPVISTQNISVREKSKIIVSIVGDKVKKAEDEIKIPNFKRKVRRVFPLCLGKQTENKPFPLGTTIKLKLTVGEEHCEPQITPTSFRWTAKCTKLEKPPTPNLIFNVEKGAVGMQTNEVTLNQNENMEAITNISTHNHLTLVKNCIAPPRMAQIQEAIPSTSLLRSIQHTNENKCIEFTNSESEKSFCSELIKPATGVILDSESDDSEEGGTAKLTEISDNKEEWSLDEKLPKPEINEDFLQDDLTGPKMSDGAHINNIGLNGADCPKESSNRSGNTRPAVFDISTTGAKKFTNIKTANIGSSKINKNMDDAKLDLTASGSHPWSVNDFSKRSDIDMFNAKGITPRGAIDIITTVSSEQLLKRNEDAEVILTGSAHPKLKDLNIPQRDDVYVDVASEQSKMTLMMSNTLAGNMDSHSTNDELKFGARAPLVEFSSANFPSSLSNDWESGRIGKIYQSSSRRTSFSDTSTTEHTTEKELGNTTSNQHKFGAPVPYPSDLLCSTVDVVELVSISRTELDQNNNNYFKSHRTGKDSKFQVQELAKIQSDKTIQSKPNLTSTPNRSNLPKILINDDNFLDLTSEQESLNCNAEKSDDGDIETISSISSDVINSFRSNYLKNESKLTDSGFEQSYESDETSFNVPLLVLPTTKYSFTPKVNTTPSTHRRRRNSSFPRYPTLKYDTLTSIQTMERELEVKSDLEFIKANMKCKKRIRRHSYNTSALNQNNSNISMKSQILPDSFRPSGDAVKHEPIKRRRSCSLNNKDKIKYLFQHL
ncbi:uncharacterized protein LOC120341562 isoform X1 [Styela clava]